MFMLTVTQRGDVCHVKWKHRALCLCIWIENRDRFLWKCRYHLGCCSQDSSSRDFFFIPSVGLTEHLCYLYFHLPGEMPDSESMIFPLQPGLSWNNVASNPSLSDCQLHCIFWDVFCKITRTVYRVAYYSNISFVMCRSVDHYLTLMQPLKSLRVSKSGGFWLASPYGTMTTLTSVPVTSIVSAQMSPTTTTICGIYVVSSFTSPTLPLFLSCAVSGCLPPFVGICYC